MNTLLAILFFAAAVPHADIVQYAADQSEGTWRRCQNPDKFDLSTRDLFTTALAWCEAKRHPERLARIFDLAAQLQDRNPKSKTYGNFRWYWSHPKVDDHNAVDFCMQTATLIWIRHRDAIPADTRAKLAELLAFAAEGCRRHKVSPAYTNIAFMNAANLILLGESLDKPDIAQEGYRRLEAAVLYTSLNGTHEYCSPTYYGTDIVDLGLLEAFCARDRERQIARAMLELFWTDIGANWLPSVQRLAGAHSRTYDYLRGLGELDTALWANGWITGKPRGGSAAIYHALIRWHPNDSLRSMKLPRLVHQCWGEPPEQFRTHYLLKDISLSASAAYYGGWMDMPLTVDFAGERESVRGYFIPDGRNDPYGKIKIAAGAHQKAHHLSCFFAGAQRTTDAAALVVYREADIPTNCASLQTHFVLPKNADAFYVGDRRVECSGNVPVAPDQALVVRKGSTAVGIRVPWTRDNASIALVNDGNKFDAVRLTVTHAIRPNAAAALWVRIGDGLDTDAAFDKWRRAFAAAKAVVAADEKQISLCVAGIDSPVRVAAQSPFTFKAGAQLDPTPKRVVLEVDGVDLGRRVFEELNFVYSLHALKHLAVLKEKPFPPFPKDPSFHGYRFLSLRNFDEPFCLTLTINRDGTGKLVRKLASGRGGYKPGGLLKEQQERVVSKTEVDEFVTALQTNGFWELQSCVPPGGVDGSYWTIEAFCNGRHHFVERWTPKEGTPIGDLGRFLLQLADWKVENLY